MVSNNSTPRYKPIFTPLGDSSNSCTIDDEVSSFRLVSYNILAQSYVKSAYFPHSPSPCLRWKVRSKALLERLLSFEADILCLQELDEFESFFKGQLDSHGYSSIYVKRPGKKKDGCGIFYRSSRLSLVESAVIQYNDLVPQSGESNVDPSTFAVVASSNDDSSGDDPDRGDPNDPRIRLKRDCVGIIAAFRVSHALDSTFVIANTHIYWDPDWVDVKLAQAKHLVARVSSFQSLLSSKLCIKIPVVICGDFNSTPGDQVYSYLTSADQSVLDDATASSADQGCLPLHSLYASMKEEPHFTNCTPDFTGTLDYIFFSSFDTLKPVSLLEVPFAESEDVKGGLPNYNHPSDHLPIGTDCMIWGPKEPRNMAL
ncbi:hypothetical protein GOP47_0018891 [Adiantum capillus-veneris]|uniref:Endonuclease/exonuclease/phosphatase domain-containing protein n=1 Tax=Adiantum capillus-veneris TaxID=13818 RepID=A0A9D4UEN2_ADICA|nr:hypothetical protein GOP47_0018891 [Adiantum capillus-veneris]